FFQAEDGIRAFHVTGVQTCALPISVCLLWCYCRFRSVFCLRSNGRCCPWGSRHRYSFPGFLLLSPGLVIRTIPLLWQPYILPVHFRCCFICCSAFWLSLCKRARRKSVKITICNLSSTS